MYNGIINKGEKSNFKRSFQACKIKDNYYVQQVVVVHKMLIVIHIGKFQNHMQ